MSYDYIKENQTSVSLDSASNLRPLEFVLNNILKDTRFLQEIQVVRDPKDATVFHIKWRSIESGVTY